MQGVCGVERVGMERWDCALEGCGKISAGWA